jgi:hypothetical protein
LINTLTSKVILILGRFSTERKLVLDAIRESLAEKRYLPVMFDFAAPWQQDLTETISALAHLSRSNFSVQRALASADARRGTRTH